MSYDNTAQANKYHTQLKMEVENKQNELKLELVNEKKVMVTIPSIYDQFLGKNLPLTIGTQRIVIPVDGNYHSVPESFKSILNEVLMQIDKEHKRSQGKFGEHHGDVSPTGSIPGKTN